VLDLRRWLCGGRQQASAREQQLRHHHERLRHRKFATKKKCHATGRARARRAAPARGD
jgi:hypothetical protein